MKIKSVQIYGFGRFSNVQLESFNGRLQIIYGENEAGKTTLMAFIRAILFGFPTKQESELRYEPKQGSEYGGKLTIETERYGQVVIERVKGKARGNVSVLLEDGTIGYEPLLKDVLEGLDRTMYQAIFSFGLQDMQHLDMLQSEEIGSYLYGVGMAGKWNVTELERKLVKQQGELFKPSGKLPTMNQQLAALQALEKKRAEKETELQLDSELLQKEEEIAFALQRIQEKVSKVREKLRHEERLEMLTPLVLKQKELTLRLKKLPDLSSFPSQGAQRLTELRHEKKQLSEKCTEIDHELTQLQNKLNELSVSDELLKKQVEIKELHAYLTSYQEWKLTNEQLIYEHEQCNEQLAEVLRRLGADWNEKRLSQAITTMQAKEELAELHEQHRILKERVAFFASELAKKETDVTERKREFERINAERISKERQQQLSLRQQQLSEEEAKLKEAMFHDKQPTKSESKQPLLFIFLLLLTIGLTYMSLNSNWLGFALFTIGFLSVLFIILRKNKLASTVDAANSQPSFMIKLHDLEREKQTIQAELNKSLEIEQQCKRASQSYEDALSTYEKLVEQKEQLEQRIVECGERFEVWCDRSKFPPITNAGLALSIFELVLKSQELLRELMQYEEKLQQLNHKLKDYEERAKALAIFVHVDRSSSIPIIVEKLTEALQMNEQMEIKRKLLIEQIKQVEHEKLRTNKQLAECDEQIQQLFTEANVETEEQLLEKGLFHEEKITLERDLRLVQSQLEAQITNPQQLEDIVAEIEQTFELRGEKQRAFEQRKEELEIEEKELEKQLFACQTARKKLANESELVELHQKIEVEKTTLQQYAVEWATYETAKQMIKKAKAIYEEKRQPEVMQAAEKWFSMLTCGQYTRVFAPIDEATVTVERKDGQRFFPEELSQGTKEQLYLALRIALAEAYRSETTFPLIIDDVFVNFDDERKRAAAEAIKELARKRQVLLFTCHDHIRQLFAEEQQWELKSTIR